MWLACVAQSVLNTYKQKLHKLLYSLQCFMAHKYISRLATKRKQKSNFQPSKCRSWKILGMLSSDCRDSSLDDRACQQSLNTPMLCFVCHGLCSVPIPNKACDRQNMALDYWVIVGTLVYLKKNLYNSKYQTCWLQTCRTSVMLIQLQLTLETHHTHTHTHTNTHTHTHLSCLVL